MFTEYYRLNKYKYMAFAAIFILLFVTTFNAEIHPVRSSDNIDMAINTTLAQNVESYAGVFSVAVTASVNPMATLAVLSVLGIVEKAEIYHFEWGWTNALSDFLNKVPFIRTAKNLPIANPTACVILTIIAVALYAIRSTAASKQFSRATVDNIEEISGYVITVMLSFLPLATTQVVQAAEGPQMNYVSAGTYFVTLVIALMSAIFNCFVYMCIYRLMDTVELLAMAFPVKGMNLVVQILKALLHLVLSVLMVLSPFISVVISLIMTIIAVILFRRLTCLCTYLDYVYIKPMFNRIFHGREVSPFVHRKFPKKLRERYPDMKLAFPVFSMNRLDKRIRKYQFLWVLPKDDSLLLIKPKSFFRYEEIPISELNVLNNPLYLQKTFRFTRIRTQDRTVELVFSNEYADRWEELLSSLNLEDYSGAPEAEPKKGSLKSYFNRVFKKEAKTEDM